MRKIPDFEKVFGQRQKIETYYGYLTIENRPIGELVLTSGSVVACDPFVPMRLEPFTTKVIPGCYPVTLSIQHMTFTDTNSTIEFGPLCATIHFNPNVPLTWELAVAADQDLSLLKDDHVFGYGVDSGTGCFMDADIAQQILEPTTVDLLLRAMRKDENKIWTNLSLDVATGANILAFRTGGDGFNVSYFGYDVDDRLACLVTNLGVPSVGEEWY